VGVVLNEDGVIKLHHFDAADSKAFSLKARQHGADNLFFNSIWFEEDE
jgi:hypothetical protein